MVNEDKRKELEKETFDIVQEYIELYEDKSILDGEYTAEHLRLIADNMDKLKEDKATQKGSL